jgi:pilus assembly protein FimV
MDTAMLSLMRKGAVLGLLVGASLGADAAGLGKLTVNSALGQPLNAEIDLVSLQPGEMDSLQARVASPEAVRDARIEYSGVLRLLRFSVEKRANGQPYLKVSSAGPVNEPFVDVLIEISWPSGRIQREYPILLDPPGYAAKAAPPVAAPPLRLPRLRLRPRRPPLPHPPLRPSRRPPAAPPRARSSPRRPRAPATPTARCRRATRS